MSDLRWVEVNIHTSTEAIEPISNILHEAGVGGVVIEDRLDILKDKQSLYGEIYDINPEDYPVDGVYLKAYLPVTEDLTEKITNIDQTINHLLTYNIDLGKYKVSVKEIVEEDWTTSWKKYYKPVEISERIVIIPIWEKYDRLNGQIVIELDPGMAFGTGTHPTTALSLLSIEEYLREEDVVIDVGSGSGVLSIASALLGAKTVHAFDFDEIAIKSTKSNTALNRVSENMIIQKNDLLTNIDLQANIIVSNILAEIIINLVQDAWNNLIHGGLFITSGITKHKQEVVEQELRSIGFKVIEVNRIENWICIVAQKV